MICIAFLGPQIIKLPTIYGKLICNQIVVMYIHKKLSHRKVFGINISLWHPLTVISHNSSHHPLQNLTVVIRDLILKNT